MHSFSAGGLAEGSWHCPIAADILFGVGGQTSITVPLLNVKFVRGKNANTRTSTAGRFPGGRRVPYLPAHVRAARHAMDVVVCEHGHDAV